MTSSPKDQTDGIGKAARDSGRDRSRLLSGKLKPGHATSSTPLETLRKLHIREYQEDTYEGVTEWLGTVVKNPFLVNPNPVEGDYPVRVRVRIEKLHKGLPKIRDGNDCNTQDLYPEFVAESLETVGGQQPTIGQLVKVKFIDRHQTTLKYSNGLIIGRVNGRGDVISGTKDSPLMQLIRKKCAGRKKPVTPPPPADKIPDPNPEEPVDWETPADRAGIPPGPTTARPVQAPSTVRTLEEFRANPDVPCDEQALMEDLTKRISDVEAGDLEKIKKLIWYDLPGDPIANSIAKLHPLLRMDVANMFKIIADKHEIPLMITSGYRSVADQERILRSGQYHGTPGRGGSSYHNYGFAFDVKLSLRVVKKYNRSKFSKYWTLKDSRSGTFVVQPWLFKKTGEQYNASGEHYYMKTVANAFRDNKIYGAQVEWGENFTTPDLPHFQRRPKQPNGQLYPPAGVGARMLLQRVFQGFVDVDGYVIPSNNRLQEAAKR